MCTSTYGSHHFICQERDISVLESGRLFFLTKSHSLFIQHPVPARERRNT